MAWIERLFETGQPRHMGEILAHFCAGEIDRGLFRRLLPIYYGAFQDLKTFRSVTATRSSENAGATSCTTRDEQAGWMRPRNAGSAGKIQGGAQRVLGTPQPAQEPGAEQGLGIPAVGTQIERAPANRPRQLGPGLGEG